MRANRIFWFFTYDQFHRNFPAISRPGNITKFFDTSLTSSNLETLRERLGLDINVETLTYQENDRADAAEWLTEHGWQVRAVSNADEMARLGRPIPPDLADEAFTTRLLRAQLGATD